MWYMILYIHKFYDPKYEYVLSYTRYEDTYSFLHNIIYALKKHISYMTINQKIWLCNIKCPYVMFILAWNKVVFVYDKGEQSVIT